MKPHQSEGPVALIALRLCRGSPDGDTGSLAEEGASGVQRQGQLSPREEETFQG
jgi:hypothetical protein